MTALSGGSARRAAPCAALGVGSAAGTGRQLDLGMVCHSSVLRGETGQQAQCWADGGSGAVLGAWALGHDSSSVLSGLCTSQGTAV